MIARGIRAQGVDVRMDSDRTQGLESRIAALEAELEALKREHDDFGTQLPLFRQAFRAIDLRLRKLEGARPAPTRAAGPFRAGSPTNASQAAAAPTLAAQGADTSGAEGPQSAASPAVNPLRLIHLEDNAALRPSVELVARRWSVEYSSADNVGPSTPTGSRLLVLNLFLSQSDPLSAVASYSQWGIAEAAALTRHA
jgi:hypothetical protein